jgi:hypothetical protein
VTTCQQFDEVLDKLKFHTEKLGEYHGWRQRSPRTDPR